MKDINKILNEKIKGKIIECLMKKECSFSELVKETNVEDHGQLNYHLNSLIDEGLIMKDNGKFSKTLIGEKMGVYINQFQSREIYPLSVICNVVTDEQGNMLFLKRAKSPQKGKWGFPGGKIVLGEKISEAAEREFLEETGLKTKFKKVLGFFPTIVYNKEQISFHANLIPVLMKQISSEDKIIIDTSEHDEFKFINLKEISKYPLITNNINILKNIRKKEFCFQEAIYKS